MLDVCCSAEAVWGRWGGNGWGVEGVGGGAMLPLGYGSVFFFSLAGLGSKPEARGWSARGRRRGGRGFDIVCPKGVGVGCKGWDEASWDTSERMGGGVGVGSDLGSNTHTICICILTVVPTGTPP